MGSMQDDLERQIDEERERAQAKKAEEEKKQAEKKAKQLEQQQIKRDRDEHSLL